MITPASRPSFALARSVLGIVLATAGLLVLSGCDSSSLTAPTESTITVYANASQIALGASTTVTASVTEKGGTPVQDGTTVTFTNTLGSFSPQETTTKGGKATVTFNAGSVSGTAKLGAFSGAAKATEIEIKIGGASATKILVSASPATLPSTGGTSAILAIVTDDSGNRAPLVPVSFSTTAGTLSATSANTDNNGEATVQLSTTRAADVTARAGSAEGKVSVSLNAQLGISITPPTSIQSQTPAFFTIGVTAPSGSVVRDVSVNWGDGGSTSLGALTGSTVVSHTFAADGTYSVTVSATDTSGETVRTSTSVTVIPVQASVTITGPTAALWNASVTYSVSVAPPTLDVRGYRFDQGNGTVTPSGETSTTVSFTVQYTCANTSGCGSKSYVITAYVDWLNNGRLITTPKTLPVTVTDR